ncbi:MAG: SRPBCC domain-containing protein [Betaproteobacteria bacterium]|nr:SRPBCC domain-containing protein [Betaproteobacteria bacterium]
MSNILHKIGFKSSSTDKVYKALTTLDGLKGWWTINTQGQPDKFGGVIPFRFTLKDEEGGFDMKVRELKPGTRVLWEVIEGPPEWVGTTISWDLRQESDWAILMFKHADWKEEVEFMHHCSTKWATFLLSLKAYVETDSGSPNPNDFKLDAWE